MNDYIIYSIAALCLLNTAALAYLFISVLPQVKEGMEELGKGLADLGKRVQDFAGFIASKLG